MDVKQTSSKKELKNYINQNGFFCGVEINEINRDDIKSLGENALRTNTEIPKGENIRIYRGLATQKFGIGEESRNGYKIDVDAWDWQNYLGNAAILYQHWDHLPCGNAIEILPHEKGVDILFWIDLNALEEKDAYRVANRLVKALSTGHITHEAMWEHKETGERIKIDGLWAHCADPENSDVMDDYIFVVTKAEAVEVSMVTLPSNPKALTLENGINQYVQNNILPNLNMPNTQINSTEEEKKEDLKTEGETPEGQAAEGGETSTEEKPAGEKAPDSEEKKEESKEPETPTEGESSTEESEGEKTDSESSESASESAEECKNKVIVSKDEVKLIKDLLDATTDETEKQKFQNILNSITDQEKESKPEEQSPAPKEENKKQDSVEKNFATMEDLSAMVNVIAAEIQKRDDTIESLRNALDKIPDQKSVILHSQFSNNNKPENHPNSLANRLMKQLRR